MPSLVIRVSGDDMSDLQWLQSSCVAAVEEEVEDNRERLDGEVAVNWEYED